MRKGKVVSNTSPLLNLTLINRLELLENQFESIYVPEQVWNELEDGKVLEGLRSLREEGFLEVVEVEEDELFKEIFEDLDRGEAAALRHAIETGAELVLIDEKEGREVARRHGLNITGLIGILMKASENSEIELKTELDRLREEGFWISDELYRRVLELGG